MPSFLILLIILVVPAVLYVISVYNKLITIKKSRLKNAIQEIGNQLKRQASLIPNLTASVKGYMKHEKEIFSQITSARRTVTKALKSRSAQQMVDASSQIEEAIRPIRVVLESTPELKAAVPTAKLMDELRDTADKLTYARRTLIDLTADFNQIIATFPSNLVAGMFNFNQLPGLKTAETGEHMEVSDSEIKSPKVKL